MRSENKLLGYSNEHGEKKILLPYSKLHHSSRLAYLIQILNPTLFLYNENQASNGVSTDGAGYVNKHRGSGYASKPAKELLNTVQDTTTMDVTINKKRFIKHVEELKPINEVLEVEDEEPTGPDNSERRI